MELFSMQCFVTLAQCLKFSEAAESLYLSQSAFSKQIQTIENDLGVKLFIRNAWSTELTDAGKAVLPYAQSIVTQYEKVKNAMDLYKKETQNRLALSTISFLIHYRLSEMLFTFISANPKIHLELTENESAHSLDLLNENLVDACIVFSKETVGDEYDFFPLLRDRLVLFVGKQHPLAERKSVRLSELEQEDFQILHAFQEKFLFHFILDQCKKAGFEPRVSAYGFWINTIEDFLQHNNSISLLPEKMAAYSQNPNIQIIPIEDADPLHLSIVTRKGFTSVPFQELLKHSSMFLTLKAL
jgi:DNA-binding transcriptional LysR family regulator